MHGMKIQLLKVQFKGTIGSRSLILVPMLLIRMPGFLAILQCKLMEQGCPDEGQIFTYPEMGDSQIIAVFFGLYIVNLHWCRIIPLQVNGKVAK